MPAPSLLRKVYGRVTLGRGTVLYHMSNTPFRLDDTKPMLFLTFHPSDWDMGKYITKIKLRRNVTLFFMVDRIHNLRVYPLLDILIEAPERNLDKMHAENQKCYGIQLLREGLDGWFSTIDGSASIEVGLLNVFDAYDYEPSVRYVRDWSEDSTSRWGTAYPIIVSALFRVNSRYKKDIETYLRTANRQSLHDYTLQVLLNQSAIEYHDYPFRQIVWPCKTIY